MSASAIALTVQNERDASPYWQEVQANRAALCKIAREGEFGKRYVCLTSIENKYMDRHAGHVSEVTLETAARMLVAGTNGGASHRLSTEQEIGTFRSQQEVRGAAMKVIDEARKNTTVLKVQMVPSEDGQPMELRPVGEKPSKR